jgi:sigma-E factor negative regulatory protein RseA
MDQHSQQLQRMSAAMDEDENATDAYLAKVDIDAELKGRWARYHLIGDALRDQLPEQVNAALVTDIHVAIANEPTVLVPCSNSSKRTVLSRMVKPIAGLAIAASVAVVAVISFQQQQLDIPRDGAPELAGAAAPYPQTHTEAYPMAAQPRASLPATIPTEATSPRVSATPEISVVRWDTVNPAAASRLNSYMVNYSEYRSNLGVPGILPYVRVIGSEAEQ